MISSGSRVRDNNPGWARYGETGRVRSITGNQITWVSDTDGMTITDPINEMILVNGRNKMAYRGRRNGSRQVFNSNGRGAPRRSTPRGVRRRSARRSVPRSSTRGAFRSGVNRRRSAKKAFMGYNTPGSSIGYNSSAGQQSDGYKLKPGTDIMQPMNTKNKEYVRQGYFGGFRKNSDRVRFNSDWRFKYDRKGRRWNVNNGSMRNSRKKDGSTLITHE